MKKLVIIVASIVLLISAAGLQANAETIAKSEPYDGKVELPKTSDKTPPILTSDYEEDETAKYKGK